MLQEYVCQHPMRDVYKLRQRLIDRQTVIYQAIARWQFRLRARVIDRGGRISWPFGEKWHQYRTVDVATITHAFYS